MSHCQRRTLINGVALMTFLAMGKSIAAGPSRVGNGDDGADLEGSVEVTQGPLTVARKKAVQLLESLNTAGIAGLGKLLPEVQSI